MADPFQVSDPEPAPMMGMAPPLPGRADFPGAQPPPGWTRTYNEPQAPPMAVDPRMIKEAEGAVRSALQFQGMRGFQEAVQNGVEPQKALLQFGPRMFAGNPNAFMGSLARLSRANTGAMDTGPVQTVPALDTAGNPIPGTHILRSQRGFHVIKEPPPVKDKQAEEGHKFEVSQIKDDLKTAKKEADRLKKLPLGSPLRTAAEKEVVRLRTVAQGLFGQQPAMPTPKPAASGERIRLRNKKTGEIATYPAARKDEVPTDQFEILP